MTGIKRLVNATRFSIAGFIACFKNEEAFRQEIYATFVAVPAALYLGNSNIERALLLLSWLLIPLTELLNSAVETAIDRIGPENNELSGRAKDIGSAAVMLSIIVAAVTWGLVLIPLSSL